MAANDQRNQRDHGGHGDQDSQSQRRARHEFVALEDSLDVIRTLRPALRKLRSRSRKLHSQLEGSLSSVPLNLSEGEGRLGKDRPYHFSVSLASAREARTTLRTAEAFDYLSPQDIAAALPLLDRAIRLIWGLVH